MRIPLSKEWTAEDRLRVVAAMLPGIREDIQSGCYSVPGRPNITSLEHILHEPPHVLEQYRKECEAAIATHEREREFARVP